MKKLTSHARLYLLIRKKYQEKRIGISHKINHNALVYATYSNSPLIYTPDRRRKNNRERAPATLTAPTNFNLQFDNCVGVIKFINDLKRLSRSGARTIILDLSKVIDLREGAIAMLLSVMSEIGKSGSVYITGTEPSDAGAKNILEKSGFYKFVKRREKATHHTTKNLMRTGKSVTSPNFLSQEVRNAMQTVWNVEGRNPVIRTVIFEMMRNSCDHAFLNSKDVWWHLSISHDEENGLVKFSFVDNGAGIIDTLRANALKKVLNLFTGNEDMLDTAFRNGIESRTGLKWRGKGLPSIFESYSDGYIKNLLVISNNVFLHFDAFNKVTLPISYKGTYYYWEVDKDCRKMCFD